MPPTGLISTTVCKFYDTKPHWKHEAKNPHPSSFVLIVFHVCTNGCNPEYSCCWSGGCWL